MTGRPGTGQAPTIATRPLFDIVVALHPRLDHGDGPIGRRVVFGSAGGTFDGDRIRGEVLPGGGDWTLFRADGGMIVDVRLTLRTHDDVLVHMTYGGRWIMPPDVRHRLEDPQQRPHVGHEEYYFRTNPLFEASHGPYDWLNDIVCVGYGHLVEGGIAYHVVEVL